MGLGLFASFEALGVCRVDEHSMLAHCRCIDGVPKTEEYQQAESPRDQSYTTDLFGYGVVFEKVSQVCGIDFHLRG